jgi:hypothetical protein
MKAEITGNLDALKEKLRKKAMTIKSSIILILTVMITLNVLYAWALPTREVDCIEDNVSIFFIEFLKSLELSHTQINILYMALGLSFDMFISYIVFRFVYKNGDTNFVAKILAIIVFRLFCDYFYHPKIDETGLPESPFYSISFSKNNGNLVNHSLSIAVLGFIYIFKSDDYSMITKVIVLALLLIQSVFLLMLNTRFSVQIIFSFILAHYVDLIVNC